ncbi:MAG TPA: (deoxy)nucleoside triphosphate pyrophosphohydrolase [Bacteroidia bacterium]|nr:(deoxy)nucleoside triphosphate pyrophosphohydrolase [Bacteroidia bacterium]
MLVEVTCAVIERNGKVLAVQRSADMSLALKWEFPGGKMEAGETYEECMHREIREELGVDIAILESLDYCDQYYPERTIRLIPFICEITSNEEFVLTEHCDYIWLEPQDLHILDWAPADIKVIENYLRFTEVRVR